jgi:uncharacterized membrane protein YphA (DoxX/SURF4 family)
MKIVRTVFRILVGIVFVFSGFVKGVDPMGTIFRMQDYFAAFGTTWANPLAPSLTIFLCTLEFMIGVSLLFNLRIKWTAWALLPVMTYFTVLTLFDALFNLVPDCGCFGDAVKLTNLQTFLKNLVLMAFVIPIFMWRKKYRLPVPPALQWLLLLVVAAGFSWMNVYAYRHLPIIDFMEWKVGNTINRTSDKPAQFFVTYKNRKTGEAKEYLAPNYPWNDSVWMSEWVFVSQRAADETGSGLSLRIEDPSGNDVTREVLNIPDYQFILVSWDIEKANPRAIVKLYNIYLYASEDGYSFTALTSSLREEVDKVENRLRTPIPFFTADDVVLKTMVRSNPGLILLNRGVVVAKWAYRDIPDYDSIIKKYIKTTP